MALYTETVMDHFMHPRNVGEIADADGVGEVGNAKCGDIMKMYLKIKDNKIEDVKFETFGCGSAIASSSIATEMIKGRTLDDALALTNQEVVDALGGLPAHKLHCSVLSKYVFSGSGIPIEKHKPAKRFQHASGGPIFSLAREKIGEKRVLGRGWCVLRIQFK